MSTKIHRLEGESPNEFRLRRIYLLRDGEPSALADLYDEIEPQIADALIQKFAWDEHLQAFRERLKDAEAEAEAVAEAGELDRQPGESARQWRTFLEFARKCARGEDMGPVVANRLGEPPSFVQAARERWGWEDRYQLFEAQLARVGLDRFVEQYGAEVGASLDRQARAAALAASAPPRVDQVVDLFRTAAGHV